jgi:SPP1 family predicted phage head-tail adaptor
MTTRNSVGAMRRRLTIEAPVEVPDAAGGVVRSFATVAAVWAEVTFEGGTERSRAGRLEQAGSYRVTLRWRAGINAGMRFVDGAQVLEILTAGDPDGDRRRLVCRCQDISA